MEELRQDFEAIHQPRAGAAEGQVHLATPEMPHSSRVDILVIVESIYLMLPIDISAI
jgi:hypothetical protein